MKINNRLNRLSEYHFHGLDKIKDKLISEGMQITDLSIGDPDLPVNKSILEELVFSFTRQDFNKYPPYEGIKELKYAIMKYYEEVFSVGLDLDEIIVLIGSKEGINNIIPAVCDFGDYIIIPQPAYPVYETCAKLWGASSYRIPLKESNGYLPDLSNIPEEILKKAKLFVLNYPNNPTGAVANGDFYREATKCCLRNNIVLFNDGAYNEILKEGTQPESILRYDEKHSCIEFGTFSKIYNMTGFRIGYAVGNREIIEALLKIKSNVDSGQFIPIQLAACRALSLNRSYVDFARRIYDDRRESVKKVLKEKNIEAFNSEGTFYLWCKTPKSYSTREFSSELLNNYGIIITPGEVFGNISESYFRISLTQDKEKIVKALKNLKNY